MSFVPWDILQRSGVGRDRTLRLRVEVVALEGEAVKTLECQQLRCEVQLDSVHARSDPKLSVTLDATCDMSRNGGSKDKNRLDVGPANGGLPITFAVGPGVISSVAPHGGEQPHQQQQQQQQQQKQQQQPPSCRVKLWEKRNGMFNSTRFLGDATFDAPASPESSVFKLSNGRLGLSVRVRARWSGLDRISQIRLADHLGIRILDAGVRQSWSELVQLTQLLPMAGWADAVTDQCLSLAVGRTTPEGRSALRLCVDALCGSSGDVAGRQKQQNVPEAVARNLVEAAAQNLLEAWADQDLADVEGDSPLSVALRSKCSLAKLMLKRIPPKIARAIGLKHEWPWIQDCVDWEVLRTARAFSIILLAAEREPSGNPLAAGSCTGKTRTLRDALYHAVSRRSPAMSARILALMPPLRGRAGTADVVLLEQMLRLASTDDGNKEWLKVARLQLQRGLGGEEVWRDGQRIVRALADLAAKGVDPAQQMLIDVTLGPDRGRSSDEPRALFPERAAECAVCFEPLYQNVPSFFLDRKHNRSCVHYVCGACADTCAAQKECPICRTSVKHTAPLPLLEHDPKGWFAAASRGDGRLDPAELCHAVAACLPVDEERLLEAIEADDGPWKRSWDPDHDGLISEEEFFAPNNGLFAWILEHVQELHRLEQRGRSSAPDIRAKPAAWFDFWDSESTGNLAFGQLLRGIFAARGLSSVENRAQLLATRAEVARLWRECGLVSDTVAKAEFLRPDGLAASLANSLRDDGIAEGSVLLAALAPGRRTTTQRIT